MTRDIFGSALAPGVNVDPVHVPAGLTKMVELGYGSSQHRMEVNYNLMRWARGEERQADHSMSQSLSGVAYTDWRVILAASIAAGTAQLNNTEGETAVNDDEKPEDTEADPTIRRVVEETIAGTLDGLLVDFEAIVQRNVERAKNGVNMNSDMDHVLGHVQRSAEALAWMTALEEFRGLVGQYREGL